MESARTLIIATLGPASAEPAIMKRLVDAGVDIFRVNLSHSDREAQRKRIREAADTGAKVMIDLCGPKIRVQDATEPLPMTLAAGERVSIASSKKDLAAGMKGIVLPKGICYRKAEKGTLILIDDGNVELTIEGAGAKSVIARSRAAGEIKPRKGVVFSTDLADFPPLVEEDREALEELSGEPFEMAAASFVRTAETVTETRALFRRLRKTARIVAKIEDSAGVKNAEEITKAADGIMVARGDLGVCTPLAALPILQKRLIALGNYYRKMVIVATQMLESMTENARPTRAEVTDVANAVLDGADAVMLSGETAVGKYPVETVETMAKIIANAEGAMRTGLKSLM